MTMQNDNEHTVKTTDEDNDENAVTPCIFSRMWVFLLIFLIGVSGAILANKLKPELFGNDKKIKTSVLEYNPSKDWVNEQITALSNRLDSVENKIKDFKKTGTIKSPKKISTNNSLKLKNVNTKTNLLSVLSYIKLKDKALNGKPFDKELSDMKNISKSNVALQSLLKELEPLSLGVETNNTLYKRWNDIEPLLLNNIMQNEATNWKDRVSVALSSLISIKRLKNDAEESENTKNMDFIRSNIEKDNLSLAIEKVELLQKEIGKDLVASWVKKAKERMKLEELLYKISDAIIAPVKKGKNK